MSLNIETETVAGAIESMFTHAGDSRGVFTGVYGLSVCSSARYRKNALQLGSPNLTQKRSTKSAGSSFILGSKGQRSRWRDTKIVPVYVFALLWVLASVVLVSHT